MARKSRRDAIVAAAAHLFADKGFRATTVRDIAEEAGVLSGSLYAHIETKEDLYLQIVRGAADDFSSAVGPWARAGLDPTDKLAAMIRAHLGVMNASKAWARVYLDDDSQLPDETRMAARKLRREYERWWDQVLREGMERGTFRVPDETLARLFILSALNGMSRWFRPEGRLSADEIAETYVLLVRRVLGVD